MTRKYSFVAVCHDGRESELVQVDTHPGQILKAARQKFLINSQYVRIRIRDNHQFEIPGDGNRAGNVPAKH